MELPAEPQVTVFLVDSIGEQRGMHYYNFSLADALQSTACSVVLISTEETINHKLVPEKIQKRAGFKGIYGQKPKWYRGMMYILSLLRIGRWCQQDKPDIVHFHFFQIPLFDLLLLKWLEFLDIKTIATVHDVLPFNIQPGKKSRTIQIFETLYSTLSGLILHSAYARESLRQLNIELINKSIIIPHGNFHEISIKLQDEVRLQQASTFFDKRRILVFGTIKPNKRLDLVLNALPQVIDKYPNARLLIVGKPQDRSVAEDIELAEKLNITPYVYWQLERVNDNELTAHISNAEIIVFPYQWIYQSGAILMAMSFGKPIIATAVGSNTSLIEDQVTGILVPPDNPDDLADALIRLLAHPETAIQLGNAARNYSNIELSWKRIAESTLDYYHSVTTS